MRILLTGHEGYIGAVMTGALLEAGHDVVGLDTCLFGGCDFGGWLLTCHLRFQTIAEKPSDRSDQKGWQKK